MSHDELLRELRQAAERLTRSGDADLAALAADFAAPVPR